MTQNSVRFRMEEPDEAVYADYSSRFSSYNERSSGWRIQTFSFVSHDGDRISAGGRGHVYLGALEIRGLWVDEELRGQGIGTELLIRIEKEGANRGAKLSWLYTYSWQAEDFYARQGYEPYAKLQFPAGQYRVDMSKNL